MKTIIVVIPPKPVSGLTACLAAWEGRLTASVATAVPPSSRKRVASLPSARVELANMDATQFDGIVLMEGVEGLLAPSDDQHFIEQLQHYDTKRKLIAAVGDSCVLLARAGLLVGKPATASSSFHAVEALRRYGGIYKASPLVRAGWLITADGTNMVMFANAVADMLLG